MVVEFSKLPDNSKIWVYQADKEISNDLQNEMGELLKSFIATWTAHNNKLYAGAEFFYGRFLIVALDESAGSASGCGIDKLVNFIKQMGNRFGIDFFENSKIAFQEQAQIEFFSFKEIETKIKAGEIGIKTPIFDLNIHTKKEIDFWPKPAQTTWLSRFFFFALICFFSNSLLCAQKQAFKNAVIHIGDGSLIDNGFLITENDKIVDLGVGEPKQTDALDLKGAHIYPGFILLNSTLGLREIDAVIATLDYRETGDFNANISTATAFNTHSEIIPTLLQNGILYAQITPRGSLFAGQSSVFALSKESILFKQDLGHHLYWKEEKADEVTSILNLVKAEPNPKKNLKLLSLKGLFTGEKTLFLHCTQNQEAVNAIQTLITIGIKKIVLVGGMEVVKISQWLKENQIPVILPRVFKVADERDYISQSFELAAKMEASGVLCAVNYEGDMEAMGARNLPFSVGQTVAYGLSKEQALRLICQNPAMILGLEQEIGTLKKGLKATFFISSGDALDIKSNNIQAIFVEGKKIEIRSRQIELYNQYNR